MAYFEDEIGVPYPWAKYDQVVVHDFVAGGMENTSITTLTHYTLHTAASENIQSSEGLVAHELAHQWFGDLVTCKDWSHLWLNEGFATYYAHLFAGHKHGRDELLYGLYNDAAGILARTDDTNSIVSRRYDSPTEQFNYLAYPKGSWVLHMLRSQLGAELYQKCIKTFLERHQYDTVVTEDLNSVVEALSGRSYDQFFDQWVYHAHHPELDVNYSWDAKAKLARLSFAQSQKLSDRVLLFRFPLTVRFKSKAGTIDRSIVIKEKSEDFYFPLPEAPELVRVDPDFTLLAKISFKLPDPMLHAQLADQSDVIGRLLAIEQLSGRKDHVSIEKLKRSLNHDSFYGVRIEAAKTLRGIHTDEAFAALMESLNQSNALVRQQVIVAISGFYSERTCDLALRTLASEKNPDVVGSAIRALAPYPKTEVRDKLVQYLQSESYRNGFAEAAVSVMRSQSDPAYIEPLQAAINQRRASFTSRGLSQALGALAFVARNEVRKDAIRELLVAFTSDPRRTVKIGAIDALGTLDDPKAIPVLETFAGADKQNPGQSAAERAIARLRAAKKPVDDFQDLRKEVLDLKKENRQLRKDFEDLKKKIESSPAASAAKDAKADKPRSGSLFRPRAR